MLSKTLILVAILISTARAGMAEESHIQDLAHDSALENFIRSHTSPLTGMPLSFDIAEDNRAEVLARMGDEDSITGIIERVIVEEGTSVYDTAVWQIALTALGGERNIEAAGKPILSYWEGNLRFLHNIRAGQGGGQHFVYDREQPTHVSSNLADLGMRGFVFRILNAHGSYLVRDPLDGKDRFEGFPNWPEIHWEDWKPIAGENAWIVIAALQLHHHKYYNRELDRYEHHPFQVELSLAQEIGRAAIHLQAKNGGVRMAPIGTYFFSIDDIQGATADQVALELDQKALESKRSFEAHVRRQGEEHAMLNSEHTTWYYNEISTENNLSWYTAFKMLFEITDDTEYRLAMLRIERYLKSVWNADGKYFYQGAHRFDGFWEPNVEHFATDVQTWAICKLGPEQLDRWFGEGTAYQMWQATKKYAGIYDAAEILQGVGYTREKERISIEWTVGAIYAMYELQRYYAETHPAWSREAATEARLMRRAIEKYRRPVTDDMAAYSYSSQRDWIPFGWFSHDQEVLSMVSSCWVLLHDKGFNPFRLMKHE